MPVTMAHIHADVGDVEEDGDGRFDRDLADEQLQLKLSKLIHPQLLSRHLLPTLP